jgi:peptidoglycan/LPS O-acetylase OafA/YrhL
LTNQSTQKIPTIYFENLDALRFFAALSVFLFHIFADLKSVVPAIQTNWFTSALSKIIDKGSLGVNFFFVLSGFLITFLILNERKTKGEFSFRKFFIRRTLRIWPLYFIVVIIGFVVFPLILEGYQTTHNPVLYAAFMANIDEIYNASADPYNFLTILWSVSVEEQFYLFWGIALFFLLRVKKFKLLHFIIILSTASLVFSWFNLGSEKVIYYHTFSVCQDILVGAFIGWSLFNRRKWLEVLKNLKTVWIVVLYLLGFLLCILKNKIFVGDLLILERFVLSSFFGFIILDQIRGNHSLFKLGKIKVFNYLGKISYGLYMYHLLLMFFILKWIKTLDLGGEAIFLTYLVVSFLAVVSVASLSYYLIEKPLLKLKPK